MFPKFSKYSLYKETECIVGYNTLTTKSFDDNKIENMSNKQETVQGKIGNSDKSNVIYTHEDVIKMMNTFHTSILNRDLCMAKLTPIKMKIE